MFIPLHRKRWNVCVFVLAILFVFTCLLWINVDRFYWKLFKDKLAFEHFRRAKINFPVVMEKKSSSETELHNGYLVNTSGCILKDLNPFDAWMRKHFKTKSRIKCNRTPRLSFLEDSAIKVAKHVKSEFYGGAEGFSICSAVSIHRRKNEDNKVEFGPKVFFTDDLRVAGEFYYVECYDRKNRTIYRDFHAQIVEKPSVKKRLPPKRDPHCSRRRPLNVLLVGLDSTSRNNFIRQMPRLRAFMEKTLDAVEFRGLTKVGDNTLPNLSALLTGKTVKEWKWKGPKTPFDSFEFLWDHYRRAGAVTLFAEDRPKSAAFNWRKVGFRKQPTDYYFRPMSVAMFRSKLKQQSSRFCVGSVAEMSRILNWTQTFIEKYGDYFYFAIIYFTDGVHESLNAAGMFEDLFLEYFRHLYRSQELERTLLFFFSDHGTRFGLLRQTSRGYYESSLPFSFLVLPPWFKKQHPQLFAALRLNKRRLTTFFDVHETLLANLNVNRTPARANRPTRGLSLFREVSPARTCRHAGIADQFCRCARRMEIASDSREASTAAVAVVAHMNRLLGKHLGKDCVPLTLKRMVSVFAVTRNAARREPNADGRGDKLFLVTVEVAPSGGLFQTIVRRVAGTITYQLSGLVDRINAYNNQSHCLDDPLLVQICFCI